MNKFSNVAGSKTNGGEKINCISNISNELSKIEETFIIELKSIKYLGINLIRLVQ